VDETLDRVAQKLGDQKIHDLVGFACGVAKNVRQEAYKQAGRVLHIRDLSKNEDSLADTKDTEKSILEKLGHERQRKCLHQCVQQLSAPDRELFLAYYHTVGEPTQYRRRLAKRLGLTIGALRVRVNRLREGLEKCARKCVASGRAAPEIPFLSKGSRREAEIQDL
jgi:RNA polymerase sigma factor (sigma-70 family)